MNWKIFTSSCFILLSPVHSFFHNVSFFDNPNIFVEHTDNRLSDLETLKTSRQFFNPRRVQKLNDEFIPTHYKIELQVILDKDKVGEKVGTTENRAPGKVNIVGINQKNSSRIVLNAGRLKVNGSSIQVFSNGQKLPLKECRHKARVSLYEIELVNEIGAGEKVEIYMEYFAVLNSHLVGIRIKDFTDESTGSMEKIAFTNLQTLRAQDTGLDSTAHRPSFCYNVFPCFDEPHLKATYELTIIRKSNQIALGSGELLSSASDSQVDDWVVDKFSPTIPMPPHFFMFAVGDLEYVEKLFGIERKLRVYAPKHDINKSQFTYIAEVSAKVLTFYEQYFNSSANLTKMDLVFAPTYDLLESWGLSYHGYRTNKQGFMTTGSENLIPKEDSLIDFSVLDTISPVLAKQYFGDWWNSQPETMALTEALAEFTEFYLGWNQVDPKLAEARIMVELQSSLMKDADFYKVQRDYRRKGAPLLRMLEGILTEEGFRNGLREYIKKTTSGNQVTTTEFIHILQEAAGNRSQVPEELSLTQVLKSFLDNTGYPLLRVAVENSTHFVLTQEKFLANEKGVWYIPIKLKIGREEVRKVWLKPDGKPFYVPGNTLDFILIDPDVRGYYSVIYEDNLLDRLKQQLATSENSEFSPLAKSRLLLDYFSFADKNVTSYDTALSLSSYLSPDDDEPNYTVWLAFLWKFRSEAVRPFLGHPEFPTVHAYFASKLDPLLLELENELPSPYVTFLRHWMIKYSCRYRTSYCLTLAQNIFSLWQSTPNSTLSSFSSHFKGISDKTMECLIISAGGMSEFSFILQKYNNLKKKLPQSLTCTRDPQLIEILLVKLIDPRDPSLPSKLRRSMLANLIDNEGRGEVLPFLSTNFDSVVELIGNGDVEIILFSLYRLVEYFSTPLQLQQLDIFVELHRAELERYDGGNGKWVLRKLYEVVNKNIEWMDNKGRKILGWIETSTHSNYEFIIDNQQY